MVAVPARELFIDGAWQAPKNGKQRLDIISPADGNKIGEHS